MPTTDTLTDAEIVKPLMKALGWEWRPENENGEGAFENVHGKWIGFMFMSMKDATARFLTEPEGLGPCHEVEERLSERQRAWYSTYLRAWARSQGPESQDEYEFLLTHVPATIKAHNLAEVLRG